MNAQRLKKKNSGNRKMNFEENGKLRNQMIGGSLENSFEIIP